MKKESANDDVERRYWVVLVQLQKLSQHSPQVQYHCGFVRSLILKTVACIPLCSLPLSSQPDDIQRLTT
jgi:hypothetical protein